MRRARARSRARRAGGLRRPCSGSGHRAADPAASSAPASVPQPTPPAPAPPLLDASLGALDPREGEPASPAAPSLPRFVPDGYDGRELGPIAYYDWRGDPMEGSPGHAVLVSLGAPTGLDFALALPPNGLAAPGTRPLIAVSVAEQRAVVLYVDTIYGSPLRLIEDREVVSDEGLAERIAPNGCPVCVVEELVTLAGGQTAAVRQELEGTTSVEWVQDGIHLHVQGPYDRMTPEAALQLANVLSTTTRD